MRSVPNCLCRVPHILKASLRKMCSLCCGVHLVCVVILRGQNNEVVEKKTRRKKKKKKLLPHPISAKWQIWDNTTHVKSSAVRVLH